MENHYIATQDKFCEGLWATPSNNCILGINYAVAKTEKQFFHDGSTVLDQINTIDLDGIAKAERIALTHLSTVLESDISIYCLDPLADVFEQLTGSEEAPRFPFFPGSHVPCATKSIIEECCQQVTVRH